MGVPFVAMEQAWEVVPLSLLLSQAISSWALAITVIIIIRFLI
jgi:hypothetical protein